MSIILEELFGNPTELNAKDLAWRCNARDTEGDAEWRANTKKSIAAQDGLVLQLCVLNGA